MKVKNVSALGDLVVPALGLTVLAGQVVDVPDDAAASLLEQPDNWVKAGKSTPDAPADPAA